MFSNIIAPVMDDIVPIMERAATDQRTFVNDLTVGMYKNSEGLIPLMAAVRKADVQLAVKGRSKEYVGPKGDPEFITSLQNITFANQHVSDYISGVQTPGGSSALRLILDLIKLANPNAKIWVSDPTYMNHIPTITATGLSFGLYPFLNRDTMTLDEAGLFAELGRRGVNDVVLFHGSCHNPSGLRLTDNNWKEIARLAKSRGFLPLFDTAYQGFETGLYEDARGLITVAKAVQRVAISVSCSKNFGLYSDRTACAYVTSPNQKEADLVHSQMAAVTRATHWVPPNNGAELVKTILQDEGLKNLWMEELSTINARIRKLRRKLSEALQAEQGSNYFGYITSQNGMFIMLPMSIDQMEALRQEYGIYGLDNGRINIAAIGEDKINYIAKSIIEILSR
ncbi:MAG: aspartate aminotransferase [Flavobacterium sp.]|jgi:aspartate aminotransferase